MKSGLDYFPLDVTLDSKMELIEAEFGLAGFGVVVKLLQEIYGKHGYYIEWTNEVALLFSRKVGEGGSVVSEIVEASVRRGMFDQKLYDEFRILTSRGVQKRYFEAVSRRKGVEVEEHILLVDPAIFCENVNIRRKNVNISDENVDILKQRKEEKSREKKRRVEKSKGYLAAAAAPQGDQISVVDIFEGRPFSPRLKEEIEGWLRYKSERREKYKPTGLQKFLSQIQSYLGTHTEDHIIFAISESMASNYQGIVWDKMDRMRNSVKRSDADEQEQQTAEFITSTGFREDW